MFPAGGELHGSDTNTCTMKHTCLRPDFLNTQAKCRCKADPPALHGPYFHWTRTVAGKTVTRTLTPDQADRYQSWFDNAHRLRDLIADLEARSLHAYNDAEKDREQFGR